MPRIPVDECPAGPAMDAAVATALGFKVQCPTWDDVRPVYLAGAYSNEYDGWAEHEDWRPVLPYSTDIAAAWGLVGWCSTNLGLLATLIEWREGWNVNFSDGSETYSSFEDTEACPLAISRAFLKANGVEFVEVPE